MFDLDEVVFCVSTLYQHIQDDTIVKEKDVGVNERQEDEKEFGLHAERTSAEKLSCSNPTPSCEVLLPKSLFSLIWIFICSSGHVELEDPIYNLLNKIINYWVLYIYIFFKRNYLCNCSIKF